MVEWLVDWLVVVGSGWLRFVVVGHKSLIFASKIMTTSVIDLLTRPDVLEKAREEFIKRLQGRVYVPPIPSDLKLPLDIWTK
jgi:aminobenzoyl-glutamate utilization protein B